MNRLIKEFFAEVAKIKKELNAAVTLDHIKVWNDTVIDYDTFYFLAQTCYVKKVEKVGERFWEDIFCYLVELQLSDETKIVVSVTRESFPHNWLSEEKIRVDTAECINMLSEILEDEYQVTEVSILAPECFDLDTNQFAPREIYFSGVEAGGKVLADYGSVVEASDDVITKIP